MAGDASDHLSTFRSYAKAKGPRHKNNHKMKLFPPTGPLDDIAMNLLCPISKNKNANQHVLVITDLYCKLTRAVPISKTIAAHFMRLVQSLGIS